MTKSKPYFILWVFIVLYILYFGIFSIQRYRTLYASYYDLGIMHQTVYNTYKAIQTGDISRILELTDTESPLQVSRMSIHNDILLAFLAPFYFILASPMTLLMIQTIILAFGAWIVYKLGLHVFAKEKRREIISLVFSITWLLYSPMERSNLYDFHAVVLSTTFLLAMYYFWVTKRHRLSLLFFALSLISKEQVALTTLMFGAYILYKNKSNILKKKLNEDVKFGICIMIVSAIWFVLSIFVIIPYSRGAAHFASARYEEFGESPAKIVLGILKNPLTVFTRLKQNALFKYLFLLLGPLGFLSFLSPLHLLIALPEFAVNLLSSSGSMVNVIFHYTAVIQPFVFISAMYGFKKISNFKFQISNWKWISTYILLMTVGFSYFYSPLIYSREREIHPFVYPQKEAEYARAWSAQLKDDTITISSTGQLAPYFTSRRYFYIFSNYYPMAEYVIIRPNEIYTYAEKDELIPVYDRLKTDKRYKLVDKKENFEVYKKI